MRLSRYLLRITAATLLPLIVFALVAGWLLARHHGAFAPTATATACS